MPPDQQITRNLLRQALAFIWVGPAHLPPGLLVEWRLVAIRWIGILFVLPSVGLLDLPRDRVPLIYAVLVGAAAWNLLIHWRLTRMPRAFRGYRAAFGDALLNVATVALGGGFGSPLYFLLFTVSVASAMRYGYRVATLITLMFVGFDAFEWTVSGDGLHGSFIVRSGFLVLTALLASYLHHQAQRAEVALKRQLAHAQHDALHDRLTGLPNRALFTEQLQHALHTAPSEAHLAVLYIELDRMRDVNTTFGHRHGDLLRQEAARRLASQLPDGAALARLTDDTFAVLLSNHGATDAARAASSILQALGQPVTIDDITLDVSASIGIALAPDHATHAELLQQRADIARHAASARSGQYAFYTAGQDEHSRERLALAADLRRAPESDELRVLYQPIVSLDTGRIVEVEALVRWQHPARGMVSPGEFIPIAEDTGAIIAIGAWVLEHACAQAVRWQAQVPAARELVVSVNVSARQFLHADFVAHVQDVLRRTGLAPASLKLEITESVAMGDPELTIASLWNLKGMGVRLALDDFGTGYSSLGYLKRFPVDTLKIDKGFVDGIGISPEDAAIVAATIAFARAVELSTTVEGVETLEQLEHVRDLGADRVQGYFCARPSSADELTELLSGGWSSASIARQATQRPVCRAA